MPLTFETVSALLLFGIKKQRVERSNVVKKNNTVPGQLTLERSDTIKNTTNENSTKLFEKYSRLVRIIVLFMHNRQQSSTWPTR